MNSIKMNGGADYLYYRPGSGDSVEIFDIAVKTERRLGVGRSMVAELRKKFPHSVIYAITRESNLVARQFYSALGGVEAKLPGLYLDENMAVMYIIRP